MTVAQLIEKLQKLPGDLIVVLQEDSEGNGYDTLHRVESEGIAWDESDRNPYDREDFDEDEWQEFLQNGAQPCVILAP